MHGTQSAVTPVLWEGIEKCPSHQVDNVVCPLSLLRHWCYLTRCCNKQVVAQALGLALTIGLAVGVGVQVFGPTVLVHLAGEKSKEVRVHACETRKNRQGL